MAVKPVDRIRTMITDLERGARTLGDDIRKRAGSVAVTSELDAALRQLLQGLTTIAAQLEKAAGELRRFLETNAKPGKTKGARKAGTGKAKKAAKKATAKKASKSAAKKAGGKGAKAAEKEAKPAKKKAAKKAAKKKAN